MQRRKEHRGYVLSWQEPPLFSVNVASDDHDLQDKIGKDPAVITGQTRDDAITKAKIFVDRLLAH